MASNSAPLRVLSEMYVTRYIYQSLMNPNVNGCTVASNSSVIRGVLAEISIESQIQVPTQKALTWG